MSDQRAELRIIAPAIPDFPPIAIDRRAWDDDAAPVYRLPHGSGVFLGLFLGLCLWAVLGLSFAALIQCALFLLRVLQ
jgi:hypothetical protein